MHSTRFRSHLASIPFLPLILAFLAGTACPAIADLYVGNLSNTLFKIDNAGTVTTFSTGFDPYGIAFSSSGALFSASSASQRIVRIDSAGVLTNFATGLGDPLGLAFDPSGNLYVADFNAGIIWKFAAKGIPASAAGNAQRNGRKKQKIKKTRFANGIRGVDGIAIDSGGNVFATGFSTGSVFKITPRGVKTVLATGLAGPVGIACDSGGNVFVAERDGGRIIRLGTDGTRSVYSTNVPNPYGLAFDSGGNLFATDQFSSRILQVNTDGSATPLAAIIGEAGFLTFKPGSVMAELLEEESSANSPLTDVTVRGFVGTGENTMIEQFHIGSGGGHIVIRVLGPSLRDTGVAMPLQDPVLAVYNSNGQTVAANDNWHDGPEESLVDAQQAPANSMEAAVELILPAGDYTAVVSGNGQASGTAVLQLSSIE